MRSDKNWGPTVLPDNTALIELETPRVEWGEEVRGKLTWRCAWDGEPPITSLEVALVESDAVRVHSLDDGLELLIPDGSVRTHSQLALEPLGDSPRTYPFALKVPARARFDRHWTVQPLAYTPWTLGAMVTVGATVVELPGKKVEVRPPNPLVTVLNALVLETRMPRCSRSFRGSTLCVDLEEEEEGGYFRNVRLELHAVRRVIRGYLMLEIYRQDMPWLPTHQDRLRVEIPESRASDARQIFAAMLSPWLNPELEGLPVASSAPAAGVSLPLPSGTPELSATDLPTPAGPAEV